MKQIEKIFKIYYNAGFTKHNEQVLIKRLQSIQKNIHISKFQLKSLQKSIQYPFINGIFVILLDRCTQKEFLN